jgi:RNA-directed DNA polymerase
MDCPLNLIQIAQTPIKRHVKIRSAATPYDPQYAAYLNERKWVKEGRNTWIAPVLTAL